MENNKELIRTTLQETGIEKLLPKAIKVIDECLRSKSELVRLKAAIEVIKNSKGNAQNNKSDLDCW